MWADQQFSKLRVKRDPLDLINLVQNFKVDNFFRKNNLNIFSSLGANDRFQDPLWEKQWYMVSLNFKNKLIIQCSLYFDFIKMCTARYSNTEISAKTWSQCVASVWYGIHRKGCEGRCFGWWLRIQACGPCTQLCKRLFRFFCNLMKVKLFSFYYKYWNKM